MSSPDVTAGAPRPSPIALVERVAAVFAEGAHKLEAMRAREEYLERAGKVFDDDAELFEGRIASFLEWYIIERGFRDGPPPALRVVAEPASAWGFTDEERRRAVHLATSVRSLFEISAMQRGPGGRVELEDLLGGGRFSVLERRSTIGLEVGALFEARLFWDGESVVFGKTFLFHPPDARESVLRQVDRVVAQAGGPGAEDLLFKLSRAHVKWHRLGHLSAAKVYGVD
jgi:hypothetical protein